MKKTLFSPTRLLAAAAVAATGLLGASAQEYIVVEQAEELASEPSSLEVVNLANHPEARAIVNRVTPREPGDFGSPHFAIKSRNNRFIFTISGIVNPIMGYDIGNDLYDVAGAGADFVTGNIPVPVQKGHRGDFYINAFQSKLKFTITAFAGTENEVTGFLRLSAAGNNNHVRLSRAWVKWRGILLGENQSLAQDGLACQPPTIDPQGPNGDLATTTYQLSYTSKSYSGVRFALGIEQPSFYSSDGVYRGHDYLDYYGKVVDTDASQLIPDIPAWIEYAASDQNRIRFTGLLRNLAYRDLVNNKTRVCTGWGAMVSGNFSFYQPLTFNFQAVYGKGIGNYIQDISGRPISFTPSDDKLGHLTPTPMMGLVFGLSYNLTKKLQFNAVGSYARVWKVGDYATIGDQGPVAGNANYKHATYLAVNFLYSITSFLQTGIEYDYGHRQTWNLGGASDSRLCTTLALSF